MSQALYRKYRPKTFDEVYGQANIVNILKNQIVNNKISHAYLFSGTRGTGKTSCAKIFSRAVNCLNPVNGNPCNECANCKAVLEESTMDVVEMDAASNRRIDDIRQLRDTVIYPPTDLKYKVYIIDEAHMITNEGFNALLKIMEEPPKHLIFIMATTEVDKLPDTILSRTQRFEFKKIDNEVIEERIVDILSKENIKMDHLAINSISNIGKGSMRDALSTLDQVISINSDEFNLEQINDILGIVGEATKVGIVQAIVNKDLSNMISLVDRELDKGKDSHNIIKELIGFLELLMDVKIDHIKEGVELSEAMIGLAQKVDLEYIINALDILLEYELKIKKSDNRNLLLKMSLIRMVDNTPRDLLISKVNALEKRISALEEGGLVEKPSMNHSFESTESKELKQPASIEEGNPFDSLVDEAKKQDEEQEDKLIEESINQAQEEDLDLGEGAESNEASPSQKVEDYGKIEGSNNKQEKAIEMGIRNYVLKRFPSSKQLYDEVNDFRFSGDTLIYRVNEKGYTFAKVMIGLFRETEEAFYRQTKRKIVIKFELKPTEIEEENNKDNQRIEQMKSFFGEDNLEIIE